MPSRRLRLLGWVVVLPIQIAAHFEGKMLSVGIRHLGLAELV